MRGTEGRGKESGRDVYSTAAEESEYKCLEVSCIVAAANDVV